MPHESNHRFISLTGIKMIKIVLYSPLWNKWNIRMLSMGRVVEEKGGYLKIIDCFLKTETWERKERVIPYGEITR